jgi:hypothetical protein
MDIGYARVSTQDQHPALQLDALHAAGCAKVFVEQASGAQRDRPQLQAALDYARPGDILVVWKLDRLARSLTQLIETMEGLAAREIGFRSLTELGRNVCRNLRHRIHRDERAEPAEQFDPARSQREYRSQGHRHRMLGGGASERDAGSSSGRSKGRSGWRSKNIRAHERRGISGCPGCRSRSASHFPSRGQRGRAQSSRWEESRTDRDRSEFRQLVA